MSSRPRRAVRRALTAILPVAALLALAACGSGATPAADSTQAGAPGSPGLTAARAALAKYSERPATISVTEPVGKAIPQGKKIDFILCGVQSCKDLAGFFTEAAEELGWQVKQIATQGTPESVQAAYEQAVRDKPDAVVASGFPRAVYAKQLAQLKAAGIPVIQSNADDVTGEGVSLLKNGPKDVGVQGEMLASWVVSNSGAKADTVYFDLPAYTILKPVKDSFATKYKEWCDGCALDNVDVPITAVGKDMPDRVVSYLRSHPKVTHVVFSLGLLNVGVPAALKTAGITGKRIVVNVGDAQNYQYIEGGLTDGAMALNSHETAWLQADALARHFTGGTMAVDQKAALPNMLVTKDNLPSADGDFPIVEDYEKQFKALWGLS
ncbi:substrate-binding domain-containing protein [Streptomyces violaceochromogenes]|uniref:Substrate-binding domain-containing protein n=1 Tax=Streptomyces violaceochromogenes TaxID=67377 RepID=A0ABU6MBT2_9ACTN|nr:substrate-binding domain-containing protein [Streptomyces violaceochromogenes]MEC7058282.1 substrate-binding domain-containing protein [Streptomyces violaceochromogenes]GHC48675.1 sugar ABC transporter substrate-binding protein [Streptomyces violaceochromogenes]